MSVLLALALMWLPVILVYVIYFSVGSGFGPAPEIDVRQKAPEPKPPVAPYHFPHAA